MMIAKSLGLSVLLCLLAVSAEAQAQDDAPEEPDFFFMTGGPYTQQKHSPQIIWAQQWQSSKTGDLTVSELSGGGRLEFGLTDCLETDFEFGVTRTREQSLTLTQLDTQLDGMMLGARYRILREDFAPFTLTVGPQFLIPSSTGRPWETAPGYGIDLTAAKDWGGPVFAAGSINWRNTPGIQAAPEMPSSSLQQLTYAFAFGLRALEEETARDTRHDLHVFAEVQRTRQDDIEAGQISCSTNVFLSPGIRYGFLNKQGVLAEIGAALPLGLDRDAPNWGVILQLQLEIPALF